MDMSDVGPRAMEERDGREMLGVRSETFRNVGHTDRRVVAAAGEIDRDPLLERPVAEDVIALLAVLICAVASPSCVSANSQYDTNSTRASRRSGCRAA